MTPLAMAVLELLHERPMHPYEIQRTFQERHTSRTIKVRAGSLYHTVERLTADELIEPVHTGRAGRRPERTVYAITALGRQEFTDWVSDALRTPAQEYPQFCAALAFMHEIDPDKALEQLTVRVVGLESAQAGEDRVAEYLREVDLPEVYWTDLEYRRAMRAAELRHVRTLIHRIRAGELPWIRRTADEGRAITDDPAQATDSTAVAPRREEPQR